MEGGEAVGAEDGIAGGGEMVNIVGNGDAYVAVEECAGVVEAVADHEDFVTLGAEPADVAELVGRGLVKME